jgi:hypothetical protein
MLISQKLGKNLKIIVLVIVFRTIILPNFEMKLPIFFFFRICTERGVPFLFHKTYPK